MLRSTLSTSRLHSVIYCTLLALAGNKSRSPFEHPSAREGPCLLSARVRECPVTTVLMGSGGWTTSDCVKWWRGMAMHGNALQCVCV